MTGIDLFAGCGGASLGLHMAGVDIRAAYDCDADACATHCGLLPACPVVCADLKAMASADLPEVDLWWASPPCQAWSVAGKRLGAEDDRDLFPWTLSAIEARRPRWVCIENVPGLLSWDDGRYFWTIIDRLEQSGYTVAHRVLIAEWYGVPQRRKRVFIVANLGGVRFRWPEATHGDPAIIAPLFDDRRPWVTVRQALGLAWDRPSFPVMAGEGKSAGPSDVTNPRRAGAILRIIAQRNAMADGHGEGSGLDEPSVTVGAGNPPRWADRPAPTLAAARSGGGPRVAGGAGGEKAWKRLGIDPHSLLDRPAPTLAGATGEGGAKVYGGSASMDAWRRLGIDPRSLIDERSDHIRIASHRCATQTTGHSHGSGSGANEPCVTIEARNPTWIVDEGRRLSRLSLADCATLQSFPDGVNFCGDTQTSRYRQIGNAVPPLMAWALGNALLAAVGERGRPLPDPLEWLHMSPELVQP